MATIIRAPAMSSEKRVLVPVPAAAAPEAPAALADPGGSAPLAQQSAQDDADAALRRKVAEDEKRRQASEQQLALQRQKEHEQQQASAERAKLQEAYDAAVERGYEDGLRDGEAAGQAELRVVQERTQALLEHVENVLEQGLQVIGDTAGEVVFEALCKIVGEAMMTREGILAHVRQVLVRVRERGVVVIKLHPHDLELVGNLASTELGARAAQLRWVADAALAAGGCVVETTGGEFEARLERQLEQIRDALVAGRRFVPAGEDLT
jgi:flagellar assembly protein FliH